MKAPPVPGRKAKGEPVEFTRREHFEGIVKRGGSGAAAAQAKLDGPPFPDDLKYLYEWLMQVHGRSGVDMSGLVQLTYGTIVAWAQIRGVMPLAHEVEALMDLDAILRHPGPLQTEGSDA